MLDFEILRRVHVNRIEYVSYRQGSYRIRVVSASFVSITCRIGKVRIENVSYRQGSYRIRVVSVADRIVPAVHR